MGILHLLVMAATSAYHDIKQTSNSVRSHIGRGQSIPRKSGNLSLVGEADEIRNKPKRTKYLLVVGLGLLQKVSKPDTGRCAVRMLAPKGMDCENPHRLERGTKHCL